MYRSPKAIALLTSKLLSLLQPTCTRYHFAMYINNVASIRSSDLPDLHTVLDSRFDTSILSSKDPKAEIAPIVAQGRRTSRCPIQPGILRLSSGSSTTGSYVPQDNVESASLRLDMEERHLEEIRTSGTFSHRAHYN
ncbi:hypothetical protein LXA43DRAFT_1048575 [Ganoderma leucocontextum]|nr:hypothetical protein LXA43DRAFT_1048575 [Ganoderma leucocontextum]